MVINGASNIASTGQTGPVPLERVKDVEMDKQRLFKAAKEMESIFLYQLLKTMRQTIPENESKDSKTVGGGMGKDIYTQMFDQEIAMKMAGNTDRSIAAQIYRSMVGVLEKQSGRKADPTSGVKNILPNERYIKINQISSQPSNAAITKTRFDPYIDHAAAKFRLRPELIKAVIKAESNFNPKAVSSAGAKGLMQLMDSTALEMGVDNVFSPGQNIDAGARYLRKMIDRFGDIKIALAAYNAGPAAVEKHGGIPPYPETVKYVQSVLDSTGGGQTYY